MAEQPRPPVSAPDEPWVEVTNSRHFPSWLAEQQVKTAGRPKLVYLINPAAALAQ